MVEKFKFSYSLKLVENTVELMKQSIVIELCEHVAFYGLAIANMLKGIRLYYSLLFYHKMIPLKTKYM